MDWRSCANSILRSAKEIGQGGVGKSLNAGRRRTSCPMGGVVDMKRGVGKRTQHLLLDLAGSQKLLPFFGRCFARFTDNLVLASIKWRQHCSGKEWISFYKATNIVQIYYEDLEYLIMHGKKTQNVARITKGSTKTLFQIPSSTPPQPHLLGFFYGKFALNEENFWRKFLNLFLLENSNHAVVFLGFKAFIAFGLGSWRNISGFLEIRWKPICNGIR